MQLHICISLGSVCSIRIFQSLWNTIQPSLQYNFVVYKLCSALKTEAYNKLYGCKHSIKPQRSDKHRYRKECFPNIMWKHVFSKNGASFSYMKMEITCLTKEGLVIWYRKYDFCSYRWLSCSIRMGPTKAYFKCNPEFLLLEFCFFALGSFVMWRLTTSW